MNELYVVFYGRNGIIYACMYNQAQIVGLLLKHGVDRAIKDSEGKTALDYANEKGFADIEKLLESVR
ncbi:ankyrin repeat domain-containing protein [Flavivirga sp. 57AJ16]|uniref:ankyrin repeat domain-containing protein n=1 Tax=Flavivirga sp. 57AJ16 TaxID=3025307 RepID=UPI002365D8C6|nr:ankyrin repeat domain-containing protein [Flavivirga sp. 57AJ16]MDD7886150.1 ankyrin repeat domain-containing protein [Flavivirga sp. 57AJ16]